MPMVLLIITQSLQAVKLTVAVAGPLSEMQLVQKPETTGSTPRFDTAIQFKVTFERGALFRKDAMMPKYHDMPVLAMEVQKYLAQISTLSGLFRALCKPAGCPRLTSFGPRRGAERTAKKVARACARHRCV